MLVDFLDRDELDLAALVHNVDRPVGAVEPDGALALAVSLERLVVESWNLPHFFEADQFY
jgi:hypothetical protein